jgi:hypothetical protein
MPRCKSHKPSAAKAAQRERQAILAGVHRARKAAEHKAAREAAERDYEEATTADAPQEPIKAATCAHCGSPVKPGSKRFCSGTCRQAARPRVPARPAPRDLPRRTLRGESR